MKTSNLFDSDIQSVPMGGEQAFRFSGVTRRTAFLSNYHQDLFHGRKCWGFPCQLGEGLHWNSFDNCLYWVDIRRHRIHQFDPQSQAHQYRTFEESVCWVVHSAKGQMVAGFASGIYCVDFVTGSRTAIAKPPEPSSNRLNDASVDPSGCLWFGTMDDSEQQPTGKLYRMASMSQRPQVVDDGYVVSNGPVVTPDGRTMFHNSSSERTVYRFKLDSHGMPITKEPFAIFDDAMGCPDGMVMDAEGGLWVAQWGGHGIVRFNADGTIDRRVELPVPQVTNVCFGGENLDKLFVTTAYQGLSLQQRLKYPQAGCLFELNVGVKGLPATPFNC
ncbi:SMP-30/gluconolactonase/LRE family protein [Shewanella mangrovi]|uniref:SMP-30/gluconolactonase/LRE family protein n=1 Tax=Shewanella mangrovi TaxID=1515746 RepID=UPI00069011C4|nr:SMP-30/gluconolactonase/LRE family protein [Shewanella mangrovi]